MAAAEIEPKEPAKPKPDMEGRDWLLGAKETPPPVLAPAGGGGPKIGAKGRAEWLSFQRRPATCRKIMTTARRRR
jgi:hypothetical protein